MDDSAKIQIQKVRWTKEFYVCIIHVKNKNGTIGICSSISVLAIYGANELCPTPGVEIFSYYVLTKKPLILRTRLQESYFNCKKRNEIK